ncbi:MAG: RNA methyltransferase [Ginsengibacter sp.]
MSHKKFREEEDAFIAEGTKIVSEFLSSSNMRCTMICADKEWLLENDALLKRITSENIFETEDHWLKSISLLKNPNKVLAVFKKKPSSAIPDPKGKISLMLDFLQDPGNMGTLIRIADWFAIEDIICSDNCVDCYNPKVVQSAMGSLARVNIFYTDLASFVTTNRQVPLYATTLSGTPIFDLPKIEEGIILIGNEGHGVHEDLLPMASSQITIPRYGHAESLNAAVAAGIILSQLKNSLNS